MTTRTQCPQQQNTSPGRQPEAGSDHHLAAGVATNSTREGFQRAINNAITDWWYSGALLAVKQLANGGQGFTVDHVLDAVGEPSDPHYPGVVFASAQRQRLIEAVGCRVGRDGRMVRIWWGVPDAMDQALR